MQSLVIKIGASVGNGCVNAKCDVFRVQLLINSWRNTKKKPEIKEDGSCGPQQSMAIIVVGIASSFSPPEQKPYSKRSGELPCSGQPGPIA
jgi:hypothetical protein